MIPGCGQLLLYKGSAPFSKVIENLTRSQYSHAAMLYPCGTVVLESWDGVGVRERMLNEQDLAGYTFDRFDIPEMTPAQWQIAVAAGKVERGKKYAWLTDAAFVLTQIEPPDDEWMCSELFHYCIRTAGLLLQQAEDWKVAPGHLAWSTRVKQVTT